MKVIQMKFVSGLFWMKVEALKTVPMDVVTDIPLMHQPMDLLHREPSGLLLEPLKHYCPAKHANSFISTTLTTSQI
jgi:hypothetical protein